MPSLWTSEAPRCPVVGPLCSTRIAEVTEVSSTVHGVLPGKSRGQDFVCLTVLCGVLKVRRRPRDVVSRIHRNWGVTCSRTRQDPISCRIGPHPGPVDSRGTTTPPPPHSRPSPMMGQEDGPGRGSSSGLGRDTVLGRASEVQDRPEVAGSGPRGILDVSSRVPGGLPSTPGEVDLSSGCLRPFSADGRSVCVDP